MAEHHCVSTDTQSQSDHYQIEIDFLIFSQSHKISSGFVQDANRQVVNTIWVGGSSQNGGAGVNF